MKFRIIKYYERYKPQVKAKDKFNGVYWEDSWVDIGMPTGYYDTSAAKEACRAYKEEHEEKVVEEFEL